MLKLMKYMKPYLIIVLAIIALLFGQAMADLSLPDYMSDIVNNGIQQGGIEYAVPEVIRKSEYEKLVLLMTDSEREYVEGFYAPANSQIKDYGRFLKRFPLLNSEPAYSLKNRNNQKDERLNSIMGKAIMAVYGIETAGFEGMVDIPETMVRQSAAEYIKNEYKALGRHRKDAIRLYPQDRAYNAGCCFEHDLHCFGGSSGCPYVGRTG